MKTEQLMIRDNGFIQRISDGYFSANNLIEAWNEKTDQKKQLGNYMKNDSTIEYINQLKSEGIDIPIFTKRGRHIEAGTWVHPKVFIDLAMWVSVEFKSKVIDYVIDGLIKSRHEAGDYYIEMTKAILDTYVEYYGNKPNPKIYINEANYLKGLVAPKDRNMMNERELNILTTLQKVNSQLLRENVGKDSRRKQLEMIARSLKH
jgi:hypothetical protein